jgi:hypothetical protein
MERLEEMAMRRAQREFQRKTWRNSDAQGLARKVLLLLQTETERLRETEED